MNNQISPRLEPVPLPAAQEPSRSVVSQSISTVTEEVDLLSLLRTLWNGKWHILLCAIVSASIAFFYLKNLAVPKYRATSVVALQDQQANVVDIESVVSGISGDQASINTEVEVLKSRTLMANIAAKMDLGALPEFNKTLREEPAFSLGGILRSIGLANPPRELTEDEIQNSVVDATLGALSISNVRNSYVFRITAETESPILSRDMANVAADLYIEGQLDAKFEATERATSWLTERVAELQLELEAAEQEVKDFSVQTDLVGPAALEAQERQIKETRDRVVDAEVAVETASQRLSQLEAAEDPAALLAITNDQILRRLIETGAADGDAFTARKEQILGRAELDQSRAASQATALRNALEELEASAAGQSQDLVALRQLQREAEASRLIYEYFLSRLKETSVQQGIQEADARILSLAAAPERASSPRTTMTLAMFTILGLVMGSGLILIREVTQSTFRTSDILEGETGLPVVGQIPLMPISKRQKVLDYMIEKPTSAAMEAIRNLRTTLLLQNVDQPPQVILSTSSMPGEGKTTTSVGLALNFAGMNRKVLLIEGDIRRRVFKEYFDISTTRGLVSVLGGNAKFEDVVYKSARGGFDILQGEASRVNAADLYSSNTFETFMKEIRARYDTIIIDTPPVLLVPDARIIAQQVDAVTFSVKWDQTPKAQVRRALRTFEDVGLTVNGLVLTQVDPKRLKAYGYGEYENAGYYEN